MSDPFVAEVRIFAGNFAPKGWAFCDGQLLPLSQNTALFSLLGTTYGGNGKSNFALPDLQGRAVMHPGSGPGLSPRDLGETGGTETVTLLESEMPNHNHNLAASPEEGDRRAPATNRALAQSVGGFAYQTNAASLVDMDPRSMPSMGGNLPHNNMQPYLTLVYIIALQGVFPPRT